MSACLIAIVLSSKRSGAASWVIDKSRTRSYPPQRVQQSLTDSSDVLKSYGCVYNISTCAFSIVWGKGCPLDTALQQQLWIDDHRASASALGHHSNHHRARPLNTIAIILITHRQVAIISRWSAHLLRWIAHPQELASLTFPHIHSVNLDTAEAGALNSVCWQLQTDVKCFEKSHFWAGSTFSTSFGKNLFKGQHHHHHHHLSNSAAFKSVMLHLTHSPPDLTFKTFPLLANEEALKFH